MKIAVDISGQFGKMTGIQHYVDSLLSALYRLCPPQDNITAFAPTLWSLSELDRASGDGLFDWYKAPNCRVDLAGNELQIATMPVFAGRSVLRSLANKVDGNVINLYKRNTVSSRVRTAVRRYDLYHIPEPGSVHFLPYRPRHVIGTIYDLTTITHARAHLANTVPSFAAYHGYLTRYASRVIAISEATKADIVEHLGLSPDRVDVTPLAARISTRRIEDASIRNQVLGDLDLQVEVPFVLYAGTLEPRKNLKCLVKAFAQVIKQEKTLPHNLVLAGGNWDRHDWELRLLACEEGIGGRVLTTGYVTNEQMNVLMSACDAFTYISQYEGFGLPPLEAMVCGAPVITSNTSSLPEVVGEAGIQVPPRDVQAVATALHRLLTDRTENERRRTLSRKRAQQFSWERTAQLTLQSYKAAIA